MHSSSPQILKHHIPLSFSHKILSLSPLTSRLESPYIISDTNPLQNIKLRCIQEEQQRSKFQLVFSNKSSKGYRAKKEAKVGGLVREIGWGWEDAKEIGRVIKEEKKNNQGKGEGKKLVRSSTAQNVRRSNYTSKTYRKAQQNTIVQTQQDKLSTLFARHSLSTIPAYPSAQSPSSTYLRNIHSSQTHRRMPTRPAKPSMPLLFDFSRQKQQELKIRGRKAPEKETIDTMHHRMASRRQEDEDMEQMW